MFLAIHVMANNLCISQSITYRQMPGSPNTLPFILEIEGGCCTLASLRTIQPTAIKKKEENRKSVTATALPTLRSPRLSSVVPPSVKRCSEGSEDHRPFRAQKMGSFRKITAHLPAPKNKIPKIPRICHAVSVRFFKKTANLSLSHFQSGPDSPAESHRRFSLQKVAGPAPGSFSDAQSCTNPHKAETHHLIQPTQTKRFITNWLRSAKCPFVSPFGRIRGQKPFTNESARDPPVA
jgi:hypothetical protein